MEDSAAIIGLVIAFLGILVSNITGSPVYDAAATVIIEFILAGTALLLATENLPQACTACLA
jgi:divalent metal cation (Fe/Co/Zn/Cd) transporter